MNKLFFLVGILGAHGTLPSNAQGFRTEILALQGNAIQNKQGSVLGSLRKAQINLYGDICFRADVIENEIKKDAIVRNFGNGVEVVTMEGGVINGAEYESFQDPILDSLGRIAFSITLKKNTRGVTPNNNQLIAVTGSSPDEIWIVDRSNREALVTDSFEVDGSKHLRFGDLFFTDSGNLLYHSLLGRRDGETQYYRNMVFQTDGFVDSAVTFRRNDYLIRGEEFRQVDGSVSTLQDVQIGLSGDHGGKIRALTLESGAHCLIELDQQTVTDILRTGQDLPGFEGFQITKIRSRMSNQGAKPPHVVTAFNGTTTVEAIVRGGLDSPIETVAFSQQAVPGSSDGATFSGFGMPFSAENNSMAYTATESVGESFRQSVWRKLVDGVEPRALAKSGEQAPEMAEGVTYRSFGRPMINQLGQVVFAARLNHGFGINTQNDFAYFVAEQNLTVRRIFGEGDLFFFGWLNLLRIEELEVTDLNSAGDILFTLRAGSNASAIVKVAIPPTSYPHFEQWAEENFPTLAHRSRSADPDQDGLDNFWEYAYGTDPNDAYSMSTPSTLLIEGDSMRTLAIEFDKFSEERDINYVVEFSSDLLNWESGADVATEYRREESAPGRMVVGVRDLNASKSSRRFVRVRAED